MSSLEDLIPLVNKLQDLVFNTIGADTLDLPQVVVVGSQSCGKSSVLETIVGRDFLPRGVGIVTRRPLILQLVNIPKKSESSSSNATSDVDSLYSASSTSNPGTDEYSGNQGDQDSVRSFSEPPNMATSNVNVNTDDRDITSVSNGISSGLSTGSEPKIPAKYTSTAEEWGEFLHIPGKRFYNFDMIREEIINETARLAGTNKGISRTPINLKIYSPHVLNLTLVDLPGLTKIPIGDQPSDIEKQTRTLICDYIAKPNSVILAVSPANVDIVNSESLKLARQVDPLGKRTLGVLTKLDLMDQGTNALDILSGHVYPLKLGFIGIVNRSQQDIQENRPMSESLEKEKEFFLSHQAYRTIAHKCGTKYLAKTLNQILMAHIREKLPDIKARLNTLIGQTEQELAAYGTDIHLDGPSRGPLILQLMTKFASAFTSSIDGTAANISTKELSGGARVYYIYNNVFGKSLKQLNAVSNLSNRDIRTAIRNSTGPRPTLFVPELAFDLLVKPQIKQLESPAQRCVEMVYEELMKICHNCGSSEVTRFPKLHARLIETVSDLLRERLGPTSSYVSSLIDIQMAYINTNHPNFVGAAAAMSTVLEEKQFMDNAKEKDMLDLSSPLDAAASATINDPDDLDEPDFAGIRISSNTDSTNVNSRRVRKAPSGTLEAEMHTPPQPASSKDSFLNYFFGKENTAASPQPVTPSSLVVGESADLHANGFKASSSQSYSHSPAHSFDMTNLTSSLEEDEELSDREKLECALIKKLITSYFSIVRDIIQDQVPKAVMHLLVNHTKDTAQNRLVSQLYKEEYFDELLYEDEHIAQERGKCAALLRTYKEASRVISEVL